jgi:TonB family protein
MQDGTVRIVRSLLGISPECTDSAHPMRAELRPVPSVSPVRSASLSACRQKCAALPDGQDVVACARECGGISRGDEAVRPLVNLDIVCKHHYPQELREYRAEGSVTLVFYITATGHVADVKVEHSSGTQTLDAAAINCLIAEGRFLPMIVDDVPRASWWRWTMSWRAPI